MNKIHRHLIDGVNMLQTNKIKKKKLFDEQFSTLLSSSIVY